MARRPVTPRRAAEPVDDWIAPEQLALADEDWIATPEPANDWISPPEQAVADAGEPGTAVGRVVGRGAERFSENFGDDPLGMNPETVADFRRRGILLPEEGARFTPLQALNEILIRHGAVVGDAALRGIAGMTGAAGGVAEQTATELGESQGEARRLGRDVEGLIEVGGLRAGSPVQLQREAVARGARQAMRVPDRQIAGQADEIGPQVPQAAPAQADAVPPVAAGEIERAGPSRAGAPPAPVLDDVDAGIERELRGARQAVPPEQIPDFQPSVPGKPGERAGLFMFDPADVKVDASTFQFKGGGDPQGVTPLLRGVQRWDPDAAGQMIVWERRDGRLIVADGHQRHGLAQRLMEQGEQGIRIPASLYREADGFSAQDVRTIAALKNIREGSGEIVDAARILRDAPDLADEVRQIGRASSRAAADLAQASRRVWEMTVNGVLEPRHAASVGRILRGDEEAQGAAADLLARLKPATADEAEILVRRVRSSLEEQHAAGAQGTLADTGLFGDLDGPASTVAEETRIVARAAKELRKDRNILRRVAANAERIEETGSTLARENIAGEVDEAGALMAHMESLAFSKGPVRDSLLRLARELKDGKITVGRAVERFVEDVRQAPEVLGPRGAAAGRGGRVDAPPGQVQPGQAAARAGGQAEELAQVQGQPLAPRTPAAPAGQAAPQRAPDLSGVEAGMAQELSQVRPGARQATAAPVNPANQLVADVSARGEQALLASRQREQLRTQAVAELQKQAPSTTQPIVSQPLSREINAVIGELLDAGQVRMAPGIQPSVQVRDLLQTDLIDPDTFNAILKRHGVEPHQFLGALTQGSVGRAMHESVSASARIMQQYSALSKRINALAGERADELADILRSDNHIENNGIAFMRRLGNVWRGAMVSQLATAVRNLETSVARVGVDVLAKGVEQGLQAVFANPVRRALGKAELSDPIVPMANMVALFGPRKAKAITDAVTSVHPKVRQALFTRYSSDVSRMTGGKGVLGKIEKTVDVLNFFNKAQDWFIRRAVFSAGLQTRLAARGMDLDQIVRDNRVGAIPEDVIRESIEEALEMSWARPLGNDFISETVNGLNTFLTFGGRNPFSPLPFVRFMADALRFQYEFSPLGAARLLSPTEMKALLSGEPEQLKVASKALVGSGLLYGGYMLRQSEMAGPAWFEIKLPDGRMIDARPFAPFSMYLFVGDLIKRTQDGTLLGMSAKDLAQGLAGVNFRAGVGLFLVDKLFDDLAGVDSAGKIADIVKNYAGNVLAGFATPFQTLKDFIAQVDPEEGVVRDTRDAPLTGPARRRIPFADRGLPEAEIPTRAGPFVREEPGLRQLTGATIRSEPNPAEAELARLGFDRREIVPSSGDKVFDRLMAQHMGPLVENALSQVVTAPGYQALDNNKAKAEVIRIALQPLREQARNMAVADDAGADVRRRFRRLPRRTRALIEDLFERQGRELVLPE